LAEAMNLQPIARLRPLTMRRQSIYASGSAGKTGILGAAATREDDKKSFAYEALITKM